MNKGKKAKKVEAKQEKFNPKKYEKYGLNEEEVLEIKEAFDQFDGDHSGNIDTNELQSALGYLGMETNNQNLQNMMNEVDKNQSGSIDFDEFVEMMTKKYSEEDTKENLKKVFDLMIGNEGGEFVELRHFKRLSEMFKDGLSDEDLQDLIDRGDTDKDGKLSFEEFYAVMTKKVEG